MQKISFILALVIFTCACSVTDKAENKSPKPLKHEHRLYAESVKDSFNISVQLPEKYYQKPDEKYPDRKSTRLNSSHSDRSRMPSSA